MINNNSLKRQLTNSISIEIVPVDGSSEINERVWAINWFNFSHKWLYNLYNRLASKYVIRVGGQLLFKGYNQKKLLGNEAFGRETLLIVTYANSSNFLDMLMIKAFQMVSVLRVKAVKDFVFGFTKRIDHYTTTKTPPCTTTNQYLVYHYQGTCDPSFIQKLGESYQLSLYFCGSTIAQIKRSTQGKKPLLSPFFMDGIMVFESTSKDLIEVFVSSTEFKRAIEGNTSNYAAIFTRVK